MESTRERAAVLALMARRLRPWNQLSEAIEERESALALLEDLTTDSTRLFDDDDQTGPSLDELQASVLKWQQEGIRLMTVLDAAYPANLRMVHDRPPALFIRGELQSGDERSLAIVGTRKASEKGLAQAQEIARSAVAAGYSVVSGLAAGIDTAAHQAALEEKGRTLAVIGTGLHHNFPKQNAALQARLGRESAVISQFFPEQEARRWTFPLRNAVMSGFARATVVVEAGNTSGARMQARLAIEHGRPVFLLRSLLQFEWAQTYADDRPGTYVVDGGQEIIDHVERLYSKNLVLQG
ncbi:MAG: DNA-protecting protein DprA [Thermoleophilia bacterium]|nr:DNA-protecting protein DprA [Thermoleophilia bacterium]